MSVFVISHKSSECPKLDGYKLIQVGATGKEYYCDLADDIGDNISEKNTTYCELTGLYWIWKHIKEDYIGIVHYRRFFTESFFERKYISENRIKHILKDHDIILPIKTRLRGVTVTEQFLDNTGTDRDLEVLKNAIEVLYPDYLNTFITVFNGNSAYFRNMFVTKKNIYDDYCEWLFTILKEVESKLDISEYSQYHRRIFGFLAERLLGVYVLKNQYRIFEVGIIQTDLVQNPIKRFAKSIQRVMYAIVQR